jgi:hypothetical protein
MKRAIVAMILSGCGVDYMPTVQPHDIREHSGTRLKIEWWESGDGALVFRGIYDTARGVECAPQQAGGGTYCMPAGATDPAPYARLGHDVQQADAPVVPTSFCSADGLVVPDAFHDNIHDVDCTAEQCGLQLEFERDATRLIPGFWVDVEGVWQHANHTWDRVLSSECTVVETGDGARCMPAVQTDARTGLDAFALLVPTTDP